MNAKNRGVVHTFETMGGAVCSVPDSIGKTAPTLSEVAVGAHRRVAKA